MLVSDMTAHYLPFTKNKLHLCDSLGCLENQYILLYAVSEQPYHLAQATPS